MKSDPADNLETQETEAPDAPAVPEGTTHALLKSMVSEHLKTTGEVPDGAELGGGEQKFYIK